MKPAVEPGAFAIDPKHNEISVDAAGKLLWNGHSVTDTQLAGLLKRSTALPIEPELRLSPRAIANYTAVDRVMSACQKAGVTKMGFVGNEAYER
ncbi:biopolymer transporter ExbD [Sphingosinicellaceae bacterium]|nr:biopolymer transporter ExbD [Sphingosinicellaceae bacterium]